MRVKIMQSVNLIELNDKINDFIQDKKNINISFSQQLSVVPTSAPTFTAYILYEDKWI